MRPLRSILLLGVTMLLLIINAIALSWIFYRLVFAQQFLFWDWSDGKMELVWNKAYWSDR